MYSTLSTYGIQYASDLAAPLWYDYEPQVIATGSVMSISWPIGNASQQFFRVKPAF